MHIRMEAKRRVMNLRLTESQRSAYDRAAALEGVTVSRLVTEAADARAAEVLRTHSSLTLADDAFDALLSALDEPVRPLAAPLARAMKRKRYVNK